MSDQNWALQVMMKYRLQVDFSRRTIDCRGFNAGWYWNDTNVNFYQALQHAINEIAE